MTLLNRMIEYFFLYLAYDRGLHHLTCMGLNLDTSGAMSYVNIY